MVPLHGSLNTAHGEKHFSSISLREGAKTHRVFDIECAELCNNIHRNSSQKTTATDLTTFCMISLRCVIRRSFLNKNCKSLVYYIQNLQTWELRGNTPNFRSLSLSNLLERSCVRAFAGRQHLKGLSRQVGGQHPESVPGSQCTAEMLISSLSLAQNKHC